MHRRYDGEFRLQGRCRTAHSGSMRALRHRQRRIRLGFGIVRVRPRCILSCYRCRHIARPADTAKCELSRTQRREYDLQGGGGQTAQRVISSPLPSRPHSSGHCRLGVGITNSITRERARLSRSGGVSCERHHGAKSIIKSHRPNLTGDFRLWLTKRRRRERRCRSGPADRGFFDIACRNG